MSLRPLGPVPIDATHRWLDAPISRHQARENFTRSWERLGIPFTLITQNGQSVEPANDDVLVTVYAHQHVKLTPTLGSWCCTSPSFTAFSVQLAEIYERTCTYCEKPARARGMCWMHYTRVQRHGDPSLARTYNSRRPKMVRAATR